MSMDAENRRNPGSGGRCRLFRGLIVLGSRWREAGTAMAAALLLAACTTGPFGTPTGVTYKGDKPYRVNGVWYVPTVDPHYDVVGVASWYGRPYHGRRTASGQIFNMYALTAAHPTLPFGTPVRVTNLDNGRSVVVTINDRGPFVRGRIIDVSRHVAQHLGFVRKGTVRVRVQLIALAPG